MSHACSKCMRSTHMHVFISARMYIHVHTFIHLCRCISCKLMLVRMYVCMHVLYACMLAYLSCMCVNVCLHACVHRWRKGWGYGATVPPNFKGAL